MDFSINNRPKLPRNRYGWIGFTGTGSSSRKGGSGLDSKTLNSLYDLIDWFYKDGDFVHSKYSFVGDYEVAAYGLGDSSDNINLHDYVTNVSLVENYFNMSQILQLLQDVSAGGGGIIIPDISIQRWQEAWTKAHEHSNKAILDGITESSLNFWNQVCTSVNDWLYWDNNTSTLHSRYSFVGDHEVAAYDNGSIIDGGSYNASWIDSSYMYIINLIDNISIGGGEGGGTYIPDASVSQWNNAANLAHTHGNKAILDGITDSSISLWNETAENLNSWFYLDVSGNLNTSLNLIGHQEIMAWGKGESADADGSIQQHIDASYAELVEMINNIDIDISIDGSIDLSDYAKKDWVQNNYPDNASVWDNYVHNSSLSNLDTSLQDMDGRLDTFESWFYKDASGFIHCSSTFISDYELCAYGIGDSSEINLAGYVTGDYLETYYYNKSDIDRKIAEGIDGSIDLSGYVTMIHLEDNYPDNTSVWENYVHNASLVGLDVSLSEINTSINDISSRVNTFEGWFYKDASGFIHCSSTFISDYELAAYGMGQQGGEIVLSDYVLNVSLVENYYNKQDISNMIQNVSFDNYPTNSSVFTNYAHKTDLNEYVEKTVYNTAVQEINTSINDISTRLANNTSLLNKTNSSVNTFEKWFYKDEHGYIHCSSTFISDYEIAAYGQGTSAEGEIVLTNYVTNVSLVENYYNKQDISNMIQNVSFDNYPTNSSVFNNYAHKSDLNDYVLKSVYNPAVQNINTSILDISTRLSDVSTRLKSTDSSVKEFSRWFWKDSSGNIHCSANFIGEHEVAAFGAGQGGGEINLQGYAKIADISSSYYNKSEIDQRFDTIELDDYVKVSDFNTSTSEINASIRDLRSRIANVSQNVNNANASISGIKSDILTINNNISNLNAHINDVDNYAVNISTRLKSTNSSVADLSTRIKNVSSYAINISTKLNDWFYFQNGKLYTKYDFISEKEICAYKDGSSGQSIDYSRFVDSSTLNNYYTKREVDAVVANKMDSFDLSDYVKNSSLTANYPKNSSISSNYPKNSSVYNNYVQKTAFNSSYNELRTYISNDYLSTSSFNLIYERLIGRIADVSSKAIKNSSNLYNVSTLLKKTNSSVGRLEEWFTLDSAGNVHCTKPFIGNYEVGAYGQGSGSGGGSEIDLAGYVSQSNMNSSWVPYFDQKYFYPGKDISTTNDITAGEIYADGDLTTDGHLYAHNDLWVSSSTYLLGNASLNSSLWVKNNVYVGKQLQVTGKSTFDGNITQTGTKPILNVGSTVKTQFAALNASILFGDSSKGSINVYRKEHKINNVSVNKYDMDVFSDFITLKSLYDINLITSKVNIYAPTAFDEPITVNGAVTATGGMTTNGLITGSGNLKLNSSTAKITLGQKDSKNQYNASIIFGNDANYGYISGYKRITTNSSFYNIDIVAKDVINLTAGTKVHVDTVLELDGNLSFFDRGNIINAGEIYCEDLIYDSDQRLKKNIRPLEYKGALNPVEFDMVKTDKHSVGFVAQEVAEKYPQVVHENKDGYLSLDYPKITAILAAQVNEQNKLISALTERLNQIEKLLNK